MKAFLVLFMAITASASAAHFAVITHGKLNTEAVAAGIPTNWPARVQPIVGTNLPSQYPAAQGWVVMTLGELNVLRSFLTEAKEAWNQVQEEKERPGTIWTRREFVARVSTNEWRAFKRAAETNALAGNIMDILLLSTQIEQKNPETRQMLNGLVTLGILTTNRVEDILK